MATPRSSSTDGEAIGLLETFGLVAALEATDAMLKAANVRLVRQERTVPALITCIITGETAAVRSAVDAGRAAAERVGKVVSAHVIPRPAPDIRAEMQVSLSSVVSRPSPTHTDLGTMTVVQLRRLARERADESFSGRTISKASKGDLVNFLSGRG